jgi:hypothetical protein
MDDTDFLQQESSSSVWGSVVYVFESYGWYMLILSIILAVVYNNTIKSYIKKYREDKFEKEYSAKYHKNPDVFAAHVNAQQLWAEKMQEKYNKEAEKHEQKMKEKEEKRKQELMEKYSGSEGYVLGGRSGRKDDDKPKSLRPDYHPLMGGGSSSTYRPPRRSPCGGGGCGK